MCPDARTLLADIDRAGALIESFTEGFDEEAYLNDSRTQAAVERKCEIIGEAVNLLQRHHPELADRIPQMRRIIGFRNLLIHGYDIVVPERVWEYVETRLPQLRDIVQTLLAELGPPEE